MASRSCERTRKVNLKLPLHPQISTCHKYSPTCTALKSKQRVVPSSWQRVMTLSFNSQQVKVEEQLFFDTTKTWTGVLVVGRGGSDQCQRAVFAPAAPSSARAAWGHFFQRIRLHLNAAGVRACPQQPRVSGTHTGLHSDLVSYLCPTELVIFQEPSRSLGWQSCQGLVY